MPDERFESSDSVRTGQPLLHAHTVHFDESLALDAGGELDGFDVAYETWGTLDSAGSNAVLVCHAISGDSHAARHGPDDQPGWWDVLIGPGCPIDTERWFVVCVNTLGGCRGSTGPTSRNPASGRPWGASFPEITVGDMVRCQARLLDHLGVQRLAVVGGSLGGHQALTWAELFPERVTAVLAIATSARLTSQATAFDVVGRNAIASHDPKTGLAIARMLGHITYLSRESMSGRFDADRLASVTSYLEHQGSRFVERFDPESYRVLSVAMDRFDLDPARLPAHGRWLIASFSSDWLFPPEQSRELVRSLAPRGARVTYCNVTSGAGHDAFLLSDNFEVYGELVRGFLEPDPAAEALEAEEERSAALIPRDAAVLDLACGDGSLLVSLPTPTGGSTHFGVNPDEGDVVRAAGRGLSVVHAEPEEALPWFASGQFDCVLLRRALQHTADPEHLLREALRVGRSVVLSFENAAFDEHRQRLAKEGRAPEGWEQRPARRELSVADFEDFARTRGVRVERVVGLDAGGRVSEEPNRLAALAIVRLTT